MKKIFSVFRYLYDKDFLADTSELYGQTMIFKVQFKKKFIFPANYPAIKTSESWIG
jgi:hypothetical protein